MKRSVKIVLIVPPHVVVDQPTFGGGKPICFHCGNIGDLRYGVCFDCSDKTVVVGNRFVWHEDMPNDVKRI